MALFLSSVFKLLFFSKLPWYSHTKQGKENLIQGQKLTTAYRKIPKRSPSTVKALKLVTKKPSDKSPLQIQARGGLYSEIALKFKIKQNKTCTVAHAKNYYVCQMIAVKKCHSILLFLHSSLFRLGLDFLGPYRQNTCMA